MACRSHKKEFAITTLMKRAEAARAMNESRPVSQRKPLRRRSRYVSTLLME